MDMTTIFPPLFELYSSLLHAWLGHYWLGVPQPLLHSCRMCVDGSQLEDWNVPPFGRMHVLLMHVFYWPLILVTHSFMEIQKPACLGGRVVPDEHMKRKKNISFVFEI